MITFAHSMPTIPEFNNIPSPIQYKFDCVWEAGQNVEFSAPIEDLRGYRYFSLIVQTNPNSDYSNSRLDVALAGYIDSERRLNIGAGVDKDNYFLNTTRFTEDSAGVDTSAGLLPNDMLIVPLATDDVLPHLPQFQSISLRVNWRGALPAPLRAGQEPPSAVVLLTAYP